jgi:hypothetical protein
MNKKNKIVLGSMGALAFMILVTGGALVSAQTNDNVTTNPSSSFLDRVAQIAGIDPQKLKDSFKQVSKENVDQKLRDGKLTQEQAENIKRKIDAGDVTALNFDGYKHGRNGMGVRMKPHLEEYAVFLGITREELVSQLKDGKSLLEIANENNKTEEDVKKYLSDKFDQNIEKAINEGKITEEQGNKMKENKEDMIDRAISGNLLRRNYIGHKWQ